MGDIQYRGGRDLTNWRALCTDPIASGSERSSVLRENHLTISVQSASGKLWYGRSHSRVCRVCGCYRGGIVVMDVIFRRLCENII